MLADVLAAYVSKRTAPYLIWTVIALVAAIFLWLSFASSDRPKDGKDGQSSSSRRRMNVSLHLDGTLLKAEAEGGGLDAAAVASFIELCATCEVFAVALAAEDAREQEVMKLLESVGAFDAGLRRHRVMFSSTDAGRASMVRQLQPAVHIETDAATAAALEGKVQEIRLIGTGEWPSFAHGALIAT
mmetsp:Transcript_38390/g.90296  ORF Transcript_38390/g.90296 Transcript_38390/m.90296 type:complete len:186 (-) Transcript_38390:127-684(-)